MNFGALFYALMCTTLAQASTLEGVCTARYLQESLSSSKTGIQDLTFDLSSVSASAVSNASVSNPEYYPNGTIDFCHVTFAYSHAGRKDRVQLQYYLPAPSDFKGRYLSTGGGGYAINSGSRLLPGGILNGAVSGITDGGFGSFDTNLDAVVLLANGTLNYDKLYMFGYQGIYELTMIGKALTRQFYNMSQASGRLYSYYQGCSEGGREGWSQVQRFGDELDGAITGAPAFRFAHQQVQHLWSNVVEQTLNHYPSNCALEKILNETISYCDALDGKADNVVSRTDLCKIHFNLDTLVGATYSCPATNGSNSFPPIPASPATNGTITVQAIQVAKTILAGMKDLQGRQVYFSYQPSASFADAQTVYNPRTQRFELSISDFGADYVQHFINLVNSSTFETLDKVTYDTLKSWIYTGWQKYEDSLQTTWPDLTPFHVAGGKVLHYHGESDNSIPAASSVRYWDSVRQTMYPGMSYNESAQALSEWYRLFLVPGMAHCAPDPNQPNGLYPQSNLEVLINWVENGVAPRRLNATHLGGEFVGQSAEVCAWPLRPLWVEGEMNCIYDQASVDSWDYHLDAFQIPVF